MKDVRQDIQTRTDVELLVNEFYKKVNADALLAPVFAHVDWPAHLPTMYNFWSSALLGDMSYSDSPMAKHMNLPITKNHFSRWLELFTTTVDEFFNGFNASEAKTRALSIAGIFQHKLGLDR